MAGLFVRSLVTLLSEPRGFRIDNVAVATLFAWQEYPEPERRSAFVKQVIDRLADLPGVDQAAAGSSLPLAERIGPEVATFSMPEHTSPAAQPASAQASIVSPGYFESLGIALHAGRSFTPHAQSPTGSVSFVFTRTAAPPSCCRGSRGPSRVSIQRLR